MESLQKNSSNGFNTNFLTNPVIRKLGKVQERAAAEDAATYGGVISKTLYFLVATVLGIAVYLYLNSYVNMGYILSTEGAVPADPTIFSAIMIALVACLVIVILTPILAWLIRPAIPVVGTLYSLAQGFMLAFVCSVLGKEYTDLAWLALLITMAIVVVMLFLYMKRIIKVTAKFNSVMKVLFATMVLSSLSMLVLSFIPATSGLVGYVLANPLISIGGSIVFIIIAALFLLSDFDAIEKTVENGLPKKYEWPAAYGLAFTVIWLYLKVLSLLTKVKGSN